MTCYCIPNLIIQGMGWNEFADRLNTVYEDFVKQYEDRNFEWDGWKIWCECCKRMKRYKVKHLDRADYVRMKRHSLYYPDHCIHCDPSGDIKP